ncbi:MAG TPA: hypothetical protein VFW24_12535 [Acidimicrobiales bacterium]|nr:hypothetical protein [Acidimicrobiales bacterium]
MTVERNEYILRRMVRDLEARTVSDLTGPAVIRWCSGADRMDPEALDRAGALLD